MKLLVFAHTPPPHHGQSYMVQLMLDGLGGDRRRGGRARAGADYGVECYHVNARLSKQLEDIGELRIGKMFLLLSYCFEALWCRFRYGVTNLYYIPAPGKRSAMYRDWLVMWICRPFFKNVILHWHAAGLAKWLETAVQMRFRTMTYKAMKEPDLSIVLSQYNRADAEKIFSKQIRVVGNGIADPCPEFARLIRPAREARLEARRALRAGREPKPDETALVGHDPRVVNVLFLAHCTREKGLFDAVAGVQLANQRLAEKKSPLTFRLQVAGTFVNKADREEFDRLRAQSGAAGNFEYFGFVSGEQKNDLLRSADLFCFPTYYQNENQPVNLIEAMAFGLPILTTRWRSIPELFPADYRGLVDTKSPEQIAEALIALLEDQSGTDFRELFLRNFTLERYLAGLAEAFHRAENPAPGARSPHTVPAPARR